MGRGNIRYRAAVSILWLFPMSSVFAQLQGRFSMEKQQYAAGEPVFLDFALTNTGKERVQFVRGDRYSICGGYQIKVSSGPPITHSSCDRGFAASCVAARKIVAPGETRHERLLLNFENDLSKPANYDIHAVYGVTFGPERAGPSLSVDRQKFRVEADFHIQVVEGDPEVSSAALQPYLADLTAKDEERQREAGRIIGSMAPTSLEDTIISMADSPALLPFALIGLRRLNTPRSREALAGVVESTSGYSYWKERAIKALSEMGDKKYFPLLLDEAKKHVPTEARDYVLAAAELGQEDAMPYVVSLLESSSDFSRGNAIMALPRTASRRAVPLLIEALRDPNPDFGRLAETGLMELTHFSTFEAGQLVSRSPANDYPKWRRWWLLQGNSAPMYGPNQCGEVRPF